MKISIITPSFNSGTTIEKSIQSVLAQDYANYEHIIVDGGSTDSTLDILKRHPHLKWISEPDRGQVHAMNKGFAMATGDIIGYLNADDYYLEGAFSKVISHFQKGEKMVMGKVLVRSEKADGVEEWTCDPKTDFPSVLRHWGPNAFCVNPVGYFYLREVQEKIPLQEKTGAKHDLEFLMETALHFSIKKVDVVLGVFNHAQETQTGREQLIPSYWQPENFPFVDRLATNLPEKEQKQFRLERDRGYQLRRQWTAKEAFARGMAKELFDKGEVFLLPEDENECANSRCGFVEHDRIGTKGDWIIPVMTVGKVASKFICHTLKTLPKGVLPAEVYHIHQMNPNTINHNLPGCLPNQCHQSVGLSLKNLYDNYYNSGLQWKFIAGVRDPIAAALSGVFENWPDTKEHEVHEKLSILLNYKLNYFFKQYETALGINIFDFDFDHNKQYSIITKRNISILLYRLEDLSKIFSLAMEEFIGVPGLQLAKINIGTEKKYANSYRKVKENIRFDKDFLEKVYSSIYARHFYKADEIFEFINRWSKKNVKTLKNSADRHDSSVLITAKSAKPIDYIIFFVPRSGSTLLTELLFNTNVLGNPQEWLNPNLFEFYKNKYGYDPDNLDRYLKIIRQEQRTKNGVFGIEIAHHQFNLFDNIGDFWSCFDKKSKIIFVRRDNLIAQSISLFRAKSTQKWHVRSYDTEFGQVNYDNKKIMDSLQTIINEEIGMINFFMEYDIKPLIITYEEIVRSNIGAIEIIASHIGIRLPSNFTANEPSLKKIVKKKEADALCSRFIADSESSVLEKLSSVNDEYKQWEKIFPRVLMRKQLW